MMKKQRDYVVELWRIVFCLVILGFHLYARLNVPCFHVGYLGVEFFFLLSGYGVYVYYRKHIGGQTASARLRAVLGYVPKRLQRLYPLYLASLLSMLLVRILTEHWSLSETASHIRHGWAEFVMLQCSPLGDEVLISANWYVAALLWGSLLLLIFIALTGWIGGLILCPLISVAIYGYYFRLIGKIDVIFSYHALLRALAGIALGIFLGFLSNVLDGTRITLGKNAPAGWTRRLLFGAVNLTLTAIVVYTNFGHRSRMDFLIILLFFLCLLSLLLLHRPLPAKVTQCLQRLSPLTYVVYLFQMPVIELVLLLVNG